MQGTTTSSRHRCCPHPAWRFAAFQIWSFCAGPHLHSSQWRLHESKKNNNPHESLPDCYRTKQNQKSPQWYVMLKCYYTDLHWTYI